MADDEFLSDDDYVHMPLKEVARHELHPLGTKDRIAALEAALRRLTISKGGVTIHTEACDTQFYGNQRTQVCDCGAPEARALIEPTQSSSAATSETTGEQP